MSRKLIAHVHRPSQQQEEEVHDDPELACQQVIRIARKPQLMRSDFETQILKNTFRNIKFFREQFDSHYEDMLEDVCEHARLAMMIKGEVVFYQDTTGDTFYSILKGTVRIIKKVSYQMGQVKNKKGVMVDHYVEQVKLLTTLHNGDSFGELSLIEKKPRAATAVCDQDCYFLVLDKESFSRIIATKAKRQFMYLLEKLRENSILREVSNNTVKALFMVMERIEFKYGDYVYRQHDPSESLYFISQGEFRLQQEQYQTESTEECELLVKKTQRHLFDLKIAATNECIGLEDFIDGGQHTSQVICCSQEGVLFKLDRVDYIRLQQRYPDICQIMVIVAKEKQAYYADLSRQVSQVKRSITSPPPDSRPNTDNTKLIRKIITEDQDMSFIYRDQITLNEDNDVLMKFSRFFQIEEKTLPFQVNTVEQIQKYRVQSAGYRTLSQSAHFIPNKHDKHRGKSEVPMARVLHARSKDTMQDKVQNFLKLNLEQIQSEAKMVRMQRTKKKKSKSYLKPYRERPIEQFVPEPTTVNSPEASYFARSRPSTGKVHHGGTPISGMRLGTTMSTQRSFPTTNDTIHNYLKQSGVNDLKDRIKDTMFMVQVPLKYHSRMLKAGSSTKFGFKRHDKQNILFV